MTSTNDIPTPLQLATNVLAKAKALDPWFPNPNHAMAVEWAARIERHPYPPVVYSEAVGDFYEHAGHGEHLTLGGLLQHAKKVRDRWETDPRYAPMLNAYRQARQDERDRQIKAGTFRGALANKPTPPTATPEMFMAQLHAIAPKTPPAAPQARQNPPTGQQHQNTPPTP